MSETCDAVKNDGDPCEYKAKYDDGKCGIHSDENPRQDPGGRPCDFQTHRDKLLEAADDGLSKQECAKQVGVSEPTLHRYLNNRPEFREAFHEVYSWSQSVWAKENDVGAPSGKNHPNWKEENRGDYRGPHWQIQRGKCLERDDYQCTSCGIADKEHRSKLGYGLHVHHIVERRNFADDDPEQNELSNLVTLCHQCHEVYEDTQLSPVHRVVT